MSFNNEGDSNRSQTGPTEGGLWLMAVLMGIAAYFALASVAKSQFPMFDIFRSLGDGDTRAGALKLLALTCVFGAPVVGSYRKYKRLCLCLCVAVLVLVWLRDTSLNRERKGDQPIHRNLMETQQKLSNAIPAVAL